MSLDMSPSLPGQDVMDAGQGQAVSLSQRLTRFSRRSNGPDVGGQQVRTAAPGRYLVALEAPSFSRISHVLCPRTSTKMCRIAAGRVVAGVQDLLPLVDNATVEQERVDVRVHETLTVPEASITTRQCRAGPHPTLTTAVNFGPEAGSRDSSHELDRITSGWSLDG